MPKKLYLFINFFNKLFVIVSAVYFIKHEKMYTEMYTAAILVRGRSILMTAMYTTVPSQNALQKISNKYLTRYKNLCKNEQENKNLKLSGASEN